MEGQMSDASLAVTKALPPDASSVTSDAIDLGHGTAGDFLANCELEIVAPALTNAQLGNTSTMTYIVEHDDDSAFGSAATLIDRVIVQTGAGAGAAAVTKRVRLPKGVKRYVRVKATNSAAADASAKSLTAGLKF